MEAPPDYDGIGFQDWWGRPITPGELALVAHAQEVALVAAVIGEAR